MRRRQFSDDGVHWVDDDDDDTAFGVHVHTRLIDVAETTTVRDGEVSVFRHSETAPAPVVYDGEMHHISTAHASMDDQGRITLHPDSVPVDGGEHPAPWRWDRDTLVDANGLVILQGAYGHYAGPNGACGVDASPRVRALTEAAPQLADLVGEFAEMFCDEQRRPHPAGVGVIVDGSLSTCGKCAVCRARALLAQIEERSRG